MTREKLIAELRLDAETKWPPFGAHLLEAATMLEQDELQFNTDSAHIRQLEAELMEQARIVGLGGEREAALIAKVARLREALEGLLWYTDQLEMLAYSSDDTGIHEQVAAARAALGETA